MTKKYMDSYSAVMIAEGVEEAENEEELIEAWQFLIDTGLCWKLQGFFGRTAHDLIELGVCHAKESETNSQGAEL
jgi:hypothetical protein